MRGIILVEGDAEFILTETFYCELTGRAAEDDAMHIISISGTNSRR
ncbi:TOPRIM nucleotidyl transferase/hydrolase domain-containing protein [Pantoea agglomerans]